MLVLRSWRALWLPSPWLVAIVSMLWTARGVSLWARTGYDFTPGIGSLLGLLWDVVLVLGGQALVRSGVIVAGGAKPAWLARATGVLFGALALITSIFIRGADLAYATLTGEHWESPGFRYLSTQNVDLLLAGNGARILSVAAAAMFVGLLLIGLDQRRWLRRHAQTVAEHGRADRASAAVASALLWVGVVTSGWFANDAVEARFVPESNFAYQAAVWHGFIGELAFEPDAATIERLRERGLAPDKPLYPLYPLMRAAVDPTPFPHPRTEDGEARPNLVLTFVEQLNHDFVHAFSGDFPGLMPELSALSKRVTMVTDYRSTTSPTIHALTAGLCSVYGHGNHRRLNDGEGTETLADTPMTCLPAMLRAQGYRTVFIQGGEKVFSGKQEFLLAQGFDEMHGLDELLARYPDLPRWHWGAYDYTLTRYVQDEVRRLEALRAKDGRPYFIAMLTLDTHAPGKIPWSRCRPDDWVTELARGDKRSGFMVRALHCADRELGKIGRFILDDPVRKRSTAWMLTGDHPTYALSFVRRLYRKRRRPYRGWTERLPLLIHDPLHALPREVPVLSGHTDLAPTLLHMLGLGHLETAMTGHSIFGRRPELPLLVGRQGPNNVALYTPRMARAMRLGQLEKRCKAGRPASARDPKAMSACDLFAWAMWQQSLWRAKRIAPPGAVE